MAEVGIGEVGIVKVGTAEVGMVEVGIAEVGSGEVGIAQVGTIKIGNLLTCVPTPVPFLDAVFATEQELQCIGFVHEVNYVQTAPCRKRGRRYDCMQ